MLWEFFFAIIFRTLDETMKKLQVWCRFGEVTTVLLPSIGAVEKRTTNSEC